MKSLLVATVKYIQFVDCVLDAVNHNEELQNWPLQQEEAYLDLPIDQYAKMTTKNDK